MYGVKTGTYTGTGAAINIEIGFIPAYLRIWNETDGDIFWDWVEGMAAGTCIATSTAVAAQASNGVTVYGGTRGDDAAGFTVGTALSESAKVFRYVAFPAH